MKAFSNPAAGGTIPLNWQLSTVLRFYDALPHIHGHTQSFPKRSFHESA